MNKLLALPTQEWSATRLKLLHGATRFAEYKGDFVAADTHGLAGLALARDLGDQAGVSAFLAVVGDVALWRGEYDAARTLYEDGVWAGRAAGQTSRVGLSSYPPRLTAVFELQNMWRGALAVCYQRDYELARARAEEARSRATEAGYPRLVAQALRVLGQVSYCQGDCAVARSFLERSLEMWSALDSPLEQNAVDAAILLGCVERDSRQLARARALLSDGIIVVEKHGGRVRVAHSLDAFAGLAAACKLPERALRLARAAEELYATMGVDPSHVYRFELERWLERARQTLGMVKVETTLAAGRALTRAEAIAMAFANRRSTI